MIENSKLPQQTHAVTLAYNCVIQLGWTHVRLCHQFGISMPTLRRIRRGQLGKVQTDEYCLQVFVSIIDDAYHHHLETTGGVNATYYLRMFHAILKASLHLSR